MRKKSIFVGLLLIAICASGCSFIMHQFGRYAVLKDFCEKDAESTNYKEADVDGFFDDFLAGNFAIDYLLDKKLKWIEFCRKDGYPHSIVPTAGCWRLTRIKRADSAEGMQCNRFIDRKSIDYFYDGRKDFFTGSCLVAKKIPKQTAEYGLFYNRKTVYTDKKNKFYIFRNEMLVKSNNDIAFRAVDYRINHNNPLANVKTSCLDLSSKYHDVPMSFRNAINNILRDEYEI